MRELSVYTLGSEDRILNNVSAFASRYFDVEAFARDLFIDDYYFSDGHVFSRY